MVKVNTIGPGRDDIIVQLDKSKIESHGKPAIGDFLLKLQVMGCRGVATCGTYGCQRSLHFFKFFF